MKMKKIILLLFMFAGISNFASAQQEVTVQGEGPDYWKEGSKLAICIGGTGGKAEILANTTIRDGKFAFSFLLNEPLFLKVEHLNGFGALDFIAVPGEHITMKWEKGKLSVKGASLQKELEKEVLLPFQEQNDRRVEFATEYKAIVEKANDSLSGTDFRKSQEYLDYMREKIVLERAIYQELDRTVRQNADKIWAPIILNFNPSIKPTEELYDLFPEEVKNSFYGKKVKEKLNSILTGKKAPDFSLPDRNGKNYTLQGLLEGNQYLLLDFWASWCAPCRKGIPAMKEYAEKYAGKGLKVIGISLDSNRKAWEKALEEEQMPWLNLLDNGKLKTLFHINGIPAVFLIDSKGIVLFEKLYGESIGLKLMEILSGEF